MDSKTIVGVWRLASTRATDPDGKPAGQPFGPRGMGLVTFTSDGRMMSVVEAEGRKPPENDEQRAAAFRTIIAYTGMYRLEGDKWITAVDVAWNPAWIGTDQVRFYKLEGDTFTLSFTSQSPDGLMSCLGLRRWSAC